VTDVKYLRDLAAQCRHLAALSTDSEVSSELKEIADALIARANELDREAQGAINLKKLEDSS
jgi:hypothetical protein